jgi:hypothetical protein
MVTQIRDRIGFTLTQGHLRLGLAVTSLFALGLGGATAYWD